MRLAAAAAMLLLSTPALRAQEVDQARVDAALKRGVSWLKHRARAGGGRFGTRELVLLAVVHAGLREDDAFFREHLEAMLKDDLEHTYRVSLQAMVLEEVNRVKHQMRIHQCGQFLADNQCRNGQWSYGDPTTYSKPTPTPSRDVATGSTKSKSNVIVFGALKPGEKPAVRMKLPVRKKSDGPSRGDNSNSQYAALGVRACHDAGIVFPKEVIERARKWWLQSQCSAATDKGPYGGAGWNYGMFGDAYGSMTAGAVGSIAIYDSILGVDWKRDKVLRKGVEWVAAHFSVEENPVRGSRHHYYYLYALERAGMLYGTEKFGGHAWYALGARYLLGAQERDGSWGGTVDTCFAILFLRRATRPLVATKSAFSK